MEGTLTLDTDFFGPQPASHEESITIDIDGEYVNLPSIVDGKRKSEREIRRMYLEGKIKPLTGKHKDIPTAVNSAIERSKAEDY